MACCSFPFGHPIQSFQTFTTSFCKYNHTNSYYPLSPSQNFDLTLAIKHLRNPCGSSPLFVAHSNGFHPIVSRSCPESPNVSANSKFQKPRNGRASSYSSSGSRKIDRRNSVKPHDDNSVGEDTRETGYQRRNEPSSRKRLGVPKRNRERIDNDKAPPHINSAETSSSSSLHGKINKRVKNQEAAKMNQKNNKRAKRDSNSDPLENQFRMKLDMCSKSGNVMGAISLYESAITDGIKMGQYHYTVLLYLCASAAVGVIRPAKSGSGSRNLGNYLNGASVVALSDNEERQFGSQSSDGESLGLGEEEDDDDDDDGVEEDIGDIRDSKIESTTGEIRVSESVQKYALEKGFEIYERMCYANVPINEAALTSVARMAMAMGDGDMAFNMVKKMKELGINPRLRSYGPALSVFCNNGDIEKSFEVENHMLQHGVNPEEAELEALLKLSVEARNAQKVYYLLHRFRKTVRSVSLCTADLIEKWFRTKEASRVGKRNWDPRMILQKMEDAGGGWHGQGWLGRGKWHVSRTIVAADGLCECCGEKLALIDLDPVETERFAESVASIATKREKDSIFQKFQRWLDYHGPFEAVVDAANVGLLTQKRFRLPKVKAVVNGIRLMLSSKRWPLIILHNRRLTGRMMNEPLNKVVVEKWRCADALYATPTGSNDDWYWLYAAIKFKSLIVTNDEMRDHIFQVLGNDFFPKWKERHQVRFSFSEDGPVFHMPPPCSVVIQESSRGHWHIPVVSNHQSEEERTWLCITRGKAFVADRKDLTRHEEDEEEEPKTGDSHRQEELAPSSKSSSTTHRDLISILSASGFPRGYPSILTDIEAAEKRGNCVIDFQI